MRAMAGPAERMLEPGRGSFSLAVYTEGEAKGDGMRLRRILSLRRGDPCTHSRT